MNRRGFTIVELLIVIVVIGILAAITIVAYNGIQDRARFTKDQTNLKTLNNAVIQYQTFNGSYPNTSTIWRNQSGYGDSFIPGIKPDILSTLPSESQNSGDYTYYYISDGTNYKLIRHTPGTPGLPAVERTGNPLIDPNRPTWAWGYWTPGTAASW
jgi:prepilin-type N-terminal cleavage/methylation domain-containing protein